MINDFAFAYDSDLDFVERKVRNMIAEGWQPYGTTFSHGGVAVQALVKFASAAPAPAKEYIEWRP